jgi:hypothetical protein
MTPKVQVGAILIEPEIAQVLGLESEPYSGNWSVIKGLDGFSLDRKIHTAGRNFFFIATEVKDEHPQRIEADFGKGETAKL